MTEFLESKVVQIATSEHKLIALCSDGTIWAKDLSGLDCANWSCVKTKPCSEILHKSISCLELGVRSRRALRELEITTLGQLCETTSYDIRCVRNVGDGSVVEIRHKLNDLGLKLKDDL